ncbi:MAG TPA: DUF5810 domain-containing protein [Halococcus sp.]|nr:DUF5810 domain-containing protein [Halococcus sp.]
MGYACPVCETPQADARHLANHLAFTALLGNEKHESWLDEHTPEWEHEGEDELAERVVEYAEEVEFPQVFEDTTGHDHRDEPRSGELFEEEQTHRPSTHTPDLDPETAEAIEEAREMTRQAQSDSDTDGNE